MLRRFLLTMLSSWVANPLGVAVAHIFGVANTQTVLLLLLGTGACAPFQLFMNECLAAGVVRKRFTPTSWQLAAVIIFQIATYATYVVTLSPLAFHVAEVVILGGLLATSTFLSYRISISYYGLINRGSISMRQAVLIGAIPGLVSLAVYLSYCILHLWWPSISSAVLLLVSILPTLAQWAFLRSLDLTLHLGRRPASDRPRQVTPNVARSVLFLNIAALAVLTMAGSFLRESIAGLSIGHMALVLVGLNSFVSLANTVTRGAFLSQSHVPKLPALKSALLVTLVIAFAMLQAAPVASLFAALIATQLGVVIAVEYGRNIRTTIPLHQTR